MPKRKASRAAIEVQTGGKKAQSDGIGFAKSDIAPLCAGADV
jgi:hypothetical protein